MTDLLWQRFVDAGEQLATSEPDFFPTAVTLLEGLAHENAFRQIVQDAFGVRLPPAGRAPSARALADILCLADSTLVDVADLDIQLARLTTGQRQAAHRWARSLVAARGQGEAEATMPACVATLYRQLAALHGG